MGKRVFKKGLDQLLSSRFAPAQAKEIKAEVKKDILLIKLSDLRRIMNVTQQEIKGISQPAVTGLEKRRDMKLSTLVKYINQIGMGMEIKVFPKRKKATVPNEMLLLKV